MREVIISGNDEITFQDFLKLSEVWYKSIISSVNDSIDYLENLTTGYKVKEISLGCGPCFDVINVQFESIENKATHLICFNVFDYGKWNAEVFIDYNHSTLRIDVSKKEKNLIKMVDTFMSLLFVGGESIVNKKYKIDDMEFSVLVKKIGLCETKKLWPASKYLSIQIISQNNSNTYYYDLEAGKLCVKNDDKFVELPESVKEKIVSMLPCVSLDELPKDFKHVSKLRGQKCYKSSNGKIKTGVPGLIVRLFSENTELLRRYVLEEREVENAQPSFEEYVLNGMKYDIDTGQNKEDIKKNIKSLLAKLKANAKDMEKVTKIKLSDVIFFSSITPEKKEIDSFFKDPEIIRFCDLSEIDFTNADVRNAHLAYSGAVIKLDKLFNKSIEGADLEGISLSGQDLDGINANGANLVKTGVFVSVDKTSIIGTKFSSSSTFMIGMTILSREQIELMGIDVVEETNEIALQVTQTHF